MRITALIAENINGFAERHEIAIGPGLNVFVGRNNVGKSTLLKTPGLTTRAYLQGEGHAILPGMKRDGAPSAEFGVRMACSTDEFTSIAPAFRENLKEATVRYPDPIFDRGRPSPDLLLGVAFPEFHVWCQGSGEVEFDLAYRVESDRQSNAFRLISSYSAAGASRKILSLAWFAQYSVQTPLSAELLSPSKMPDVNLWMRTLQEFLRNAPFVTWAHPEGVNPSETATSRYY